jgi:hypothetical protein
VGLDYWIWRGRTFPAGIVAERDPTREDAGNDCVSAVAFALEGDPRDYDTETLTFDVNVAPEQPDSAAASGSLHQPQVLHAA